MNPNRLHDRESFYKHTSAMTAKVILAGGKLRWSAPARFNDPFDVPRDILDGIDESRLWDAAVDRLKELAMNPELPHPEHHSETTRALLEIFVHADEELRRQLVVGIEESRTDPATDRTGFKLFREQWRQMHNEQRILCFTERWDSASMWDRYSDGHAGVLFEFACLDHVDSAWLGAKPVKYTDDILHVNTVENLAALMLYTQERGVETIIEEYTHTKTSDWAYEKEWRIASWKRSHESGDFSDYGFLPQELVGVTFGASISQGHLADIRLIIAALYPNTKIWQASFESGRRLTRSELSMQ